MPKRDLTALNRTMSHALRHEPWLYELKLDSEGWTPVEALLDTQQEAMEAGLSLQALAGVDFNAVAIKP